MPLSIGVNLRVTGHCNQGGRKYMEDMFSVAYQQSSNDRELEYAFFGIFDGHGGGEAATFAKENLMDIIVKQKNFWSDNDEDVLKAIRDGYVNTHYAMWRELDKWPRTASGLPSTAGTTASIAFIRKGKIYIGHVGDSAIILGYQEKGVPMWKSKALTRDHKPECGTEMTRIHESGGKVVSKSGVPRVVWNRPRIGHKGPVRRSTHIDEIPFLAVARSLGDLWSYNSELNTFVVSPEPDVKVIEIDVKAHRCLIFGTDGLWNMLTPQAAVSIVQAAEKHNEKHLIASQQTGSGQGETQMWINPSKSLVDRALDRWSCTRLRADNTSVVTLMLDPPGPTHSEILLSQKREQMASNQATQPVHTPIAPIYKPSQPIPPEPEPFTCQPTTIIPKPIPGTVGSDMQKYPDSSNQLIGDSTNLPSKNVPKHVFNTAKETSKLGQISKSEESIQVAEISSSNVNDDQQNSIADDSIIEPERSIIQSSICRDDSNSATNKNMELDTSDTKFLLERKSWLQEVPEAEQYTNKASNADLQPIRYSDPELGPRLRRSGAYESRPTVTANSSLSKRVTPAGGFSNTVVIRKTSRRRHTAGIPQNGQRASQQRRSLTPKSSSCLSNPSSSRGLKRTAKALENDYDEPKAAVGAKSGVECKFEAKDSSDNGEPSLKRRTRSEDLRNTQDENNPVNQKVENQQPRNRLRWSMGDPSISRTSGVLNASSNGIRERRLSSPSSFKRRNLEKKMTPVKTIRRPSINRSTGRIQITRDGFWSDQSRVGRRQPVIGLVNATIETSSTTSFSTPKRWLRSDTIAATPIKTLRSRNVDIAGHTVPPQVASQYDVVKTPKTVEQMTKLNKPSTTSVSANESIMTATPSSSLSSAAKVKSVDCSMTLTPIATPNRTTKQNCSSVTPNVSNSSSCTISSSSSSNSSSITKRTKSPYNLSARSLSTRSRIKRFSK